MRRLALASLAFLLVAVPATAEPFITAYWSDTDGDGTPGDSSIDASVGDRVTLVLELSWGNEGLSGVGVSLAFDPNQLAVDPGSAVECPSPPNLSPGICFSPTFIGFAPLVPGVSEVPGLLSSFDLASLNPEFLPGLFLFAEVSFHVLDNAGGAVVEVQYEEGDAVLDAIGNTAFPSASAEVLGPPIIPPITSPLQTLASADVTAEFVGAVGERTVEDEVAAKGDKITAGVGNQATPERFEIGTLPAGVDVKGLARRSTGEVLFAIDVPVSLPGVAFAEPRDLLEYDPVSGFYSVALDGTAAGVPAGVAIDAVLIGPAGELFVSFDTSFSPGSHADDEDLVEVTSATTLGGVLDLSDLGFDPRLDLDAVSAYDETIGDFVTFSFDTAGSIDGVPFEDEDGVTTFDLDDPDLWFVVHDGSERFDAWSRADLDAVHFVPEPGTGLGLLCGAALLGRLQRRKPRARPA